jgi:HSP20 family protein
MTIELMPPPEPAIRVEEIVAGDRLTIRIEAPGIDPTRDISVAVAGGHLHLTLTRRETVHPRHDSLTRTEFRYGSLQRTLPVPDRIKAADITTSYVDGIVEIKIPLGPHASRRSNVFVRDN